MLKSHFHPQVTSRGNTGVCIIGSIIGSIIKNKQKQTTLLVSVLLVVLVLVLVLVVLEVLVVLFVVVVVFGEIPKFHTNNCMRKSQGKMKFVQK
jgi:predicted MFS family arabinose efflux permease